MIIGKSSIESTKFDCLVFCILKTNKIIIPDFIEQISPFTFYRRPELQRIEFSKDSKLY